MRLKVRLVLHRLRMEIIVQESWVITTRGQCMDQAVVMTRKEKK